MNTNSSTLNVDAALAALEKAGQVGSDFVRAALVEKQARDVAAAKEAVIAVLAQGQYNMDAALHKLRQARRHEAVCKAQVDGLDTAYQSFLQHGDVNKYSQEVDGVRLKYIADCQSC
jgi:riboflavin biosynthesis pyrimidine reductase